MSKARLSVGVMVCVKVCGYGLGFSLGTARMTNTRYLRCGLTRSSVTIRNGAGDRFGLWQVM